MNALGRRAAAGLLQLSFAFGICLFGAAGTFDFWQAWGFVSLFLGFAVIITAYLWQRDPSLLERRVNAGAGAESDPIQKRIQVLASAAFIGELVVPAFDRRYGWSIVPTAISILGDALIVAGFLIVFAVFRENSFAAATIEVGAGQSVVSTGPYRIVRHPMYAGALVLLDGVPLALGSWWGLLVVIPMAAVIVWRLVNEERFLTERLPGYADYRRNVRYRLVPLLW
jgi:protein-S-isoprenylcysteine O-methyltransferase Ste14